MYDPSVPNRCICDDPACTIRILDGQRLRTITDPRTGVPFVHPCDVLDCLIATAAYVSEHAPLEMIDAGYFTVLVADILHDWLTDPSRRVLSTYVADTATPDPSVGVGPDPQMAALARDCDLADGWPQEFDDKLRGILDGQ